MRARFFSRVGVEIQIITTLASGWLANLRERLDRPKFDIRKARRYWAELPEKERTAMYLHVDHGLAYDQIAELTGITPGEALRRLTLAYSYVQMRFHDMAIDDQQVAATIKQMAAAPSIRIYQIHDTEWWAGSNLDEVVAAAARAWGFDPDSDDYRMMREDAIELTEETMKSLQFSYDDDNPALKRSFREELDLRIADPTNTFPQFFGGVQ